MHLCAATNYQHIFVFLILTLNYWQKTCLFFEYKSFKHWLMSILALVTLTNIDISHADIRINTICEQGSWHSSNVQMFAFSRNKDWSILVSPKTFTPTSIATKTIRSFLDWPIQTFGGLKERRSFVAEKLQVWTCNFAQLSYEGPGLEISKSVVFVHRLCGEMSYGFVK